MPSCRSTDGNRRGQRLGGLGSVGATLLKRPCSSGLVLLIHRIGLSTVSAKEPAVASECFNVSLDLKYLEVRIPHPSLT